MDSSVAEGSDTIDRMSKPLPWLLAVYGLTSLAHFMHNAEYLSVYPNLPAWLSRSEIYGVWCAMTCSDSTVFFTINARHLPPTVPR
jgi:hypothetical protein